MKKYNPNSDCSLTSLSASFLGFMMLVGFTVITLGMCTTSMLHLQQAHLEKAGQHGKQGTEPPSDSLAPL